MVNLRIATQGSLKVITKVIDLAARGFAKAADYETKKFAEEVKSYVQSGVEKGSFNPAPLSPGYAARKTARSTTKSRGVSVLVQKPILVDTGKYIRSIQVRKDRDGYRVGPSPKFDALAQWLEFGTSRMPPRPHWRPTIEWAKTRVPDVGRKVLHGLRTR